METIQASFDYQMRDNLMGEACKDALRLDFDRKQWSLRTLRDKLIKIGAKVVSHSRYVIFQMAEVAVPQRLFRKILDRIRRLQFLTIPARPG